LGWGWVGLGCGGAGGGFALQRSAITLGRFDGKSGSCLTSDPPPRPPTRSHLHHLPQRACVAFTTTTTTAAIVGHCIRPGPRGKFIDARRNGCFALIIARLPYLAWPGRHRAASTESRHLLRMRFIIIFIFFKAQKKAGNTCISISHNFQPVNWLPTTFFLSARDGGNVLGLFSLFLDSWGKIPSLC